MASKLNSTTGQNILLKKHVTCIFHLLDINILSLHNTLNFSSLLSNKRQRSAFCYIYNVYVCIISVFWKVDVALAD